MIINIDTVTKEQIENLVTNSVGESKTLEFKQELPGNSDNKKKEFLADVSSFANASGGTIIYGIKEVDGVASEIVPLEGRTVDEAKLWIENVIRAGIEPRMPIHIKEITGFGGDGNGFIIIIRIPQSFASPHMVIFKKSSRFYCRNSAEKYQLDVQEIRSAFLATDSQAERIRGFLQDRLAKIMADETPCNMANPHKLVLHIIPLNPFLNHKRLDFSAIHMPDYFKPIGHCGWDDKYNLDGVLTHWSDVNSRVCHSYCQTFFNGTIEAVYADILEPARNDDSPSINSLAYERYLVASTKDYFEEYKALEVEPPFIISISLLNCKGAYLDVGSRYFSHNPENIDRNVAIFPEIQVESFDKEVPAIMQPIFDAVWNAFGYSHSYNYTDDGTWRVREL